jgi:transposase
MRTLSQNVRHTTYGFHAGQELTKDRKARQPYPLGYIIQPGDELIGVIKGHKQILAERNIPFRERGECFRTRKRREIAEDRKAKLEAWRADKTNDTKLIALLSIPTNEQVREAIECLPCDCPSCVLEGQHDFAYQKSALEELYEHFNEQHGTYHRCIFLPKFHPELNPIERCWGRMKWHVRRHCDGTMETLRRLIMEGIGLEVLPLSLIRKYIRLSYAYVAAYREGKDIVAAEQWIRKHRSHRSHSRQMDDQLNRMYYALETIYNPAPHCQHASSEPTVSTASGAGSSSDGTIPSVATTPTTPLEEEGGTNVAAEDLPVEDLHVDILAFEMPDSDDPGTEDDHHTVHPGSDAMDVVDSHETDGDVEDTDELEEAILVEMFSELDLDSYLEIV